MSNIKKLWGKSPHPIIKEIGAQLSDLGFSEQPLVESESGAYTWRRSISDTLAFFFTVTPESCSGKDVTFDADIGIESRYFVEIINGLAIWECDPWYSNSAKLMPVRKTVYFVVVSLHWLLLNADKPIKRLSWTTGDDTFSSCAKQLVDDLIRYGIPFIESVDTEEKIVSLLRNIDNYPKKTVDGVNHWVHPNLRCYCLFETRALLYWLRCSDGSSVLSPRPSSSFIFYNHAFE